MKLSFRPGETVWLEMAGEPCEIRERLGADAESESYRGAFNGRECALKWYFPAAGTAERRAKIKQLVRKGAPSDSFLWPCDVATSEGSASFGYVTPLREARFRSLGELLSRKVDPTFRTLTTLGLELTEAFMRLHAEGYCHPGVSLGQIFLDPHGGEILLGENDEVATDGEEWRGELGTPRFLAPELVNGAGIPSVATDLHALAVILFYLLMGHHPLEGRHEVEIACLDLASMRKLYGGPAVFIFDPKNLTNRPVPGVQDNALIFWNFYPGYLRDLFVRAFTAGLHDPHARVSENEWRATFTRMRDQIYYCDHCGAESFLSDSGNAPGRLPDLECWSCRQTLPPPLRLRLVHHVVILNQNTVLFAHHLDTHRRNDFSQILAKMEPHPRRPDIWGLKNVSAQPWSSVSPSGLTAEVAVGRSISLVPGLRIYFGTVEGTVL